MLKKLRAALAAMLVLALASPASAQSANSRSTLQSTINSDITTNGAGAITGAILNTVLSDIIDSVLFGATDLGANVLAAVNANWASNIQAFLTAGFGSGADSLAEHAVNTSNGPAGYIQGSGAPLTTVNCTIPDSAAAGTNWCAWETGSAILIPYFDTFSITSYASCSTTYPVIQIEDVSASSSAGTTTVGNNTTVNTVINGVIGGAAGNAQYAFRVVTQGSGCSTTLGTEFISVSVTVRGG